MKKFFTFIWEVLEEMGRARAQTHLKQHGRWDY